MCVQQTNISAYFYHMVSVICMLLAG